jgi:hypothetical protein
MEAPTSSQGSENEHFDCKVCREYRENPRAPPSPATNDWPFDLDEVSHAAENGCPVCSVLRTAVSSVITEPIMLFAAYVSETKRFFFAGPEAKGSMFYFTYFTPPHCARGAGEFYELYSPGSGCVPLRIAAF